ncbi:MAG: PH domain-containing protein [Euryarchaeota archaeon]|nr:PH domain-containing protein [Euryarchaeota archaeon]
MVNWKIGDEFNPAKQLKTLYYIYFVITIVFAVLIWFIPVVIFVPLFATIIIAIPVLVILLFVLYWIPKFYTTISYKLDNEEVEWRRGVWFKNTGIVPYNRITNVDVSQGPISRMLDIGSLKIQTAGYSNPNQGWGNPSEITIDGVEGFEELRHIIMDRLRGKKPAAVQIFEETPQEDVKDIQIKILIELVEMKKLLQKISKK